MLSPYLRARRLREVAPFLGRRILDVGCGLGSLATHLRPDQAYTGIEREDAMVNALRERLPQHTFLRCDVERDDLPRFEEPFDTVALTAVIEHLDRPEEALRRCLKSLRPGGVLVLTTPTPFGRRAHCVAAYTGLASVEAARGHRRAYDRAGLEKLLASVGLAVETYRRFLLGMNQLVVARKPGGEPPAEGAHA